MVFPSYILDWRAGALSKLSRAHDRSAVHQHWAAGGDDFYPGEYQKTYVYVNDSDGDGEYSLNEDLDRSMYFRLRGTNVAVNAANETDAAGNPLSDFLATDNLGLDGADEAWMDLWFYSNPIFVYVE